LGSESYSLSGAEGEKNKNELRVPERSGTPSEFEGPRGVGSRTKKGKFPVSEKYILDA